MSMHQLMRKVAMLKQALPGDPPAVPMFARSANPNAPSGQLAGVPPQQPLMPTSTQQPPMTPSMPQQPQIPPQQRAREMANNSPAFQARLDASRTRGDATPTGYQAGQPAPNGTDYAAANQRVAPQPTQSPAPTEDAGLAATGYRKVAPDPTAGVPAAKTTEPLRQRVQHHARAKATSPVGAGAATAAQPAAGPTSVTDQLNNWIPAGTYGFAGIPESGADLAVKELLRRQQTAPAGANAPASVQPDGTRLQTPAQMDAESAAKEKAKSPYANVASANMPAAPGPTGSALLGMLAKGMGVGGNSAAAAQAATEGKKSAPVVAPQPPAPSQAAPVVAKQAPAAAAAAPAAATHADSAPAQNPYLANLARQNSAEIAQLRARDAAEASPGYQAAAQMLRSTEAPYVEPPQKTPIQRAYEAAQAAQKTRDNIPAHPVGYVPQGGGALVTMSNGARVQMPSAPAGVPYGMPTVRMPERVPEGPYRRPAEPAGPQGVERPVNFPMAGWFGPHAYGRK